MMNRQATVSKVIYRASDVTNEEERRNYLARRQKNNLSSKASRANKKKNYTAMNKTCVELERKNSELVKKITEVEKMKNVQNFLNKSQTDMLTLRKLIVEREQEIEIRTAAFAALTRADPSNPSLQFMECSIFESDNHVDQLKIELMQKELGETVAEYGERFDNTINKSGDTFMKVVSTEGLFEQDRFLQTIVKKTTEVVEAKNLLEENIKSLAAFVVSKRKQVSAKLNLLHPVKRLDAPRLDRPRDLGKLVCTNLSKESREILDKLIKTPFTSALNYKLQTS